MELIGWADQAFGSCYLHTAVSKCITTRPIYENGSKRGYLNIVSVNGPSESEYLPKVAPSLPTQLSNRIHPVSLLQSASFMAA